MQSKIMKALTFALVAGLLGGCAADMNRINQQVEEAKATAERALSRANDAYNLAQSASTTASDAAYSASQAQSAADSALECCNNNSSKIERMFEKAMLK